LGENVLLDTLTSDDFAPLLDDEFEVSCDGRLVALTLSALDVMEERYSRPGARLSFSLTFSGPLKPLLPQGVHTLHNEALGALELFMVPLGPSGDGQCYEIVLN
jgi:hypothetical protein